MNTSLATVFRACGLADERISKVIAHLPPDIRLNDGESRMLLHVLRELSLSHRIFINEIGQIVRFLEREDIDLSGCDRARFLHLSAFHRWKQGSDLFQVLHRLNAAVSILREVDSDESRSYQGRVHDTYARVLQNNGMYKDALYEYGNALSLKEEYDDKESLAMTYGNIGRLHMEIGEYERAFHFLDKDALYIASLEPTVENRVILAKLYAAMGVSSVMLGRFGDAEELLLRSRSENKSLRNLFGLVLTGLQLASMRIAQDMLLEAIREIEGVEALLEGADAGIQGEFSGWLDKVKGDHAAKTGSFPDAYRHYLIAEERYSSADSSIHLVERAAFFHSLARVCLELGYSGEAAKYFRKALELLDHTDNEPRRKELEQELEKELPESWMLYNSGRFIGHLHVERLLQKAGSQGFQGERKEVLVLFADIRDFTKLSEAFPPDRLVVFLNAYLSSMTRCIEHYGGYVDKFVGDAVMGVFNLFEGEVCVESNVAEKALLAAMLMLEEVTRFNRSLPPDIPRFRIGIGLHSGEVVSGLIGSPQKRSYTVIGDTVNTAARIESLTKVLNKDVLISADLKAILPVAPGLNVEAAGRHRLKGKSGEMMVFAVTP